MIGIAPGDITLSQPAAQSLVSVRIHPLAFAAPVWEKLPVCALILAPPRHILIASKSAFQEQIEPLGAGKDISCIPYASRENLRLGAVE